MAQQVHAEKPVAVGSSRRKWWWLLLILLVGGTAYGFWRHQTAHKPAPFRFETTTVDRGRIVARVTATGTLSALVTVQIGSQVSGRMQEIKVDFNSTVHKGDVLARIDPQLFQAAVEQASANLMAAKGELAKAKAQAIDAQSQLRRSGQLAEKNFIAQADLDTARANAAVAQAQIGAARGRVAQAQAALHQAEVNLGYTTIVSPINGTVISRSVDVGQTVAASLQAPTLFLIAEDLSRMQVDTSVAEADIGKLSPGMAASFSVDAWPGETFRGSVRQIRNAPQTVQNVVTYDAVIDVENPKLQLKPGMTANVTFVYAERHDALRVANAGLRFRPPPELTASLPEAATASAKADAAARPAGAGRGASGERSNGSGRGGGAGRSGGSARGGTSAPGPRTVWVLHGATPLAVSVQTGLSDGTVTEIVEGALRPGDVVVTDAVETEPSKPAATSQPPGGMRRVF